MKRNKQKVKCKRENKENEKRKESFYFMQKMYVNV